MVKSVATKNFPASDDSIGGAFHHLEIGRPGARGGCTRWPKKKFARLGVPVFISLDLRIIKRSSTALSTGC